MTGPKLVTPANLHLGLTLMLKTFSLSVLFFLAMGLLVAAYAAVPV